MKKTVLGGVLAASAVAGAMLLTNGQTTAKVAMVNGSAFDSLRQTARESLVAGTNPTLHEMAQVRVLPGNPSAQDVSDLRDQTVRALLFDTANATAGAACDGLSACASALELVGSITGEAAERAEITSGVCSGPVGPFQVWIKCGGE